MLSRLYRRLSLASLLLVLCHPVQAEDFYQEALEYRRGGELQAAVIQLKNLLSEQPDHGKGRLLLGELYLQLGQFPGAEKELHRAEQLGIKGPRLSLSKARLQLGQGQYREAAEALLAPEVRTPELDSERLLLLGKAYTALGRFADAEQAFAAAEAQAPAAQTRLHLARLALLQWQPEVAIERAEQELDQEPFEQQARAIIAEAHLQQRDPAVALRWFDDVLAHRPGQPVALLGKAKAELMLGELAAARETLDELLALAPVYPDGVRLSAALHLRTGEPRAAKRLLDPLSQRLGPNADVDYLRAYANLRLGDAEQAERQWARILTLDPGHRATRLALTRLYLQQRRISEARDQLAPLLEEGSEDAGVLALAGTVSLMGGEADEAADYFRQALTRNDKLSLTGPLAMSELLSGETGAGLARLESLAEDETSLQTDMLVLRGYLGAQQPDKARALLRERLQTRSDPLPYRLLGAVLENQLEQPQAARAHLEAALEQDPQSLPALMAMARLALGRQDTAAAHQWYARAAKAAPAHIGPVRGWLRLMLAEGNTGGAEQLAADFYRANRDQAGAAGLYLSLLERLQRTDAFRTLLEEAINEHPGEPGFKMQRIKLHAAREQDPDRVLLALEQLLVEHPDYLPAQVARIRLMLLQNKEQQVLGVIDSLSSAARSRPQIALLRADTLRALGRGDDALAVYQQLIERRPDSVVAWNNLAWLYHEQSNPRARYAAEQAYRLAPDNAEVKDTLGWILLGSDRRQALKLLEEAVRARPNDPTVNYHYAAALARNARHGEAEALLHRLDKVEFAEKAQALRLLDQLRTGTAAPAG